MCTTPAVSIVLPNDPTAAMTRIDFHSNISDRILYACRLTRKARATGGRIVLLAQDGRQRDALDQALWTFSELDFLPHVGAGDPLAKRTPIVLAEHDTAEMPHHQILINLSGAVPSHFARFERLIEIVGSEDADLAGGRERWRFYKDRGYPLAHFVAGTP